MKVSVGFFNYATRSVGYSVPTAGEALPWTFALQPHRPAGKLGYCVHPFLPSEKYYQWSKTYMQFCAVLRQRVGVCIYFVCTCALHMSPESRWREKNTESSLPAETDTITQKHIETLSQICRTHPRYTQHLHATFFCWNLDTLLSDKPVLHCWDRQIHGREPESINSLFILWPATTILPQGVVWGSSRLSTLISLSFNMYLVKLCLWCGVFPWLRSYPDGRSSNSVSTKFLSCHSHFLPLPSSQLDRNLLATILIYCNRLLSLSSVWTLRSPR